MRAIRKYMKKCLMMMKKCLMMMKKILMMMMSHDLETLLVVPVFLPREIMINSLSRTKGPNLASTLVQNAR